MVAGRKKWGIALLCFLALVLINPKAIAADSGTCGDHLTWTIDEAGTLTIKGTGDMYDYSGKEAPWKSAKITNVVIEPGVTNVGKSAFMLCTELTKVTLPGSVTRIDDGAFAWCFSLSDITIPNGVTSIGRQTFQGIAITELNIPDSVETVEFAAFYQCRSLVSLSIPASVTSIGDGAFSACTHLTDFNVDGKNPAYFAERGALFNKNQTTLLAFAGNRGGSYGIPNSVTRIEGRAFEECGKLTKIEIPESVTRIGGIAFASCTSLETIEVSTANPRYSAINGVLFDKEGKTLIAYPGGRAGSYIVPKSVTEITGHAFEGSANLTDVTILTCVTTIGDNAFWNSANLKKVVIPSSVTKFSNLEVFKNCDNLTALYYSGSPSEWNSIDGVEGLLPKGAILHCRFEDVPSSAYYSDAVNWAVAHDVTNGSTETTFSPGNTCTTANIITFLWRANGSPEPKFSDVQTGQYYAKAAVWAHEKGMVSGNTFNGSKPCTRASTMKYLWILSGSPAGASNPFSDVPSNSDYAQTVTWAVAQGVTNGTTATTFSPNNTCTRGQIATFLLRYYMR